jgi:hypothetical protein
MAVVVRETKVIEGRSVQLKVYKPHGSLSKEDRVRADRLDEVLAKRVPIIAQEVGAEVSSASGLVHQRYLLGRKLRKILDNRNLVRASDIAGGYVWEAIWYYLPEWLRPEGTAGDESYADKENRRKGMFSLCYEISAYDWSDVGWIKRWHDWYEIASRPGLLRDRRVLRALAARVAVLDSYPSNSEFQEIAKSLGAEFPTRRLRDSALLSDKEICRTVEAAVDSVIR